MWRAWFVGGILIAAGCPGESRADPPPAPDGCETAPTGDWSGAVGIRLDDEGISEARATVRWTLVSSDHCVDRYEPSGSVSLTARPGDCRRWATPRASIAADDGELILDRNTAPARYRMRGGTSWASTWACPGEPDGEVVTVGARWGDHRGTTGGGVIAGGVNDRARGVAWRFTSSRAASDAPVDCDDAPPTPRWYGAHRSTAGGVQTWASITWERIDTRDCVDVYAPSGTVALTAVPTDACASMSFQPSIAGVAPGDGRLIVDRSTTPPTYRLSGASSWEGETRCTSPSGSTTTRDGVSVSWATGSGELTGDRNDAGTSHGDETFDWALRR